MKAVPQIKAAYDWSTAAFDREVASAMAAGDSGSVERLAEKQDTVERGLFVLLFAQFESVVTEYFEHARDARVSVDDWSRRRGWDIPGYAGKRVAFETKLALVLDRENPVYGKILQAYALRNHCAHGNTSVPVRSIDQLVKDLYVWMASLQK